MKKYLFIPLLPFLLFACQATKIEEKIPSDVLPEDKMVQVMIDVQLLESSFTQKHLPHDSAVFLYSLYEKDLFKKHQITDSTYWKSFKYYSARPIIMDKIYERVVDSLSLREEQKRL
ncbi:MAG TPA: DUF4296 domain-containing protein [Cytophagaceae bacterium]|nr:DUF4296 domain-containing protein [Cytophagaceae bacterium]